MGQEHPRLNQEGGEWGDVLGGDIGMRGPNPFLNVIKLSLVRYHVVESNTESRLNETFRDG